MKEVEFLQFLIENLVMYKDDIVIESKEDELGVLLTLKVHQDDVPIIVGKSGRTLQSLRTVLRIFGMKNHKKMNLKLLN